MLDQIAAAFDRQDYKIAAQLLKQWQQQSPNNPWIPLYRGRLQEAAGKKDTAEALYRQILREVTHPKILGQAREGLLRLEAQEREQRQRAVEQIMADPTSAEIGFLVLEPILPKDKQTAAQAFARIMKLDAYTARLHLPSRGWRLYRVGAVGELQLYGEELRAAGIPAFWASIEAIRKIRVFQVHHLQSISPQPTVICQNEAGQIGSLTFDWSEVTQRVEGLLPLFEDVVDVGLYNKLKRKEQTQDYVQMVDLHLPKRNTILRFCDRSYQFQNGVIFDASQDGELSQSQSTTRIRWNQMLNFFSDRFTSATAWSDFTPFGETALEFLNLVSLPAQIHLFRKAPTNWDPAFHLYSGLVFVRSR